MENSEILKLIDPMVINGTSIAIIRAHIQSLNLKAKSLKIFEEDGTPSPKYRVLLWASYQQFSLLCRCVRAENFLDGKTLSETRFVNLKTGITERIEVLLTPVLIILGLEEKICEEILNSYFKLE